MKIVTRESKKAGGDIRNSMQAWKEFINEITQNYHKYQSRGLITDDIISTWHMIKTRRTYYEAEAMGYMNSHLEGLWNTIIKGAKKGASVFTIEVGPGEVDHAKRLLNDTDGLEAMGIKTPALWSTPRLRNEFVFSEADEGAKILKYFRFQGLDTKTTYLEGAKKMIKVTMKELRKRAYGDAQYNKLVKEFAMDVRGEGLGWQEIYEVAQESIDMGFDGELGEAMKVLKEKGLGDPAGKFANDVMSAA